MMKGIGNELWTFFEEVEMNKTELFKQLEMEYGARREYLKLLPHDVRDTIYDNQYVNSFKRAEVLLIEAVFGKHTDAVMRFLCEGQQGVEVGRQTNYGYASKTIKNIDQYIDWMTVMEGWDEE